MKKQFILLCMLAYFQVSAQEPENEWFDFWLGKWEVSWDEAGGKTGKGTNTIVKILDNTVIQENFKAEEGAAKGYLGTSLSVFNPKTKGWHQGYADNQGAYFNFIGERKDDKRIFHTQRVDESGKVTIQRMVFYDISQNQFKWDWESSTDGGTTWNLNWRIFYKRID